jgi:L-2,4-diaminobutyric acid acetyltransferase
LKPQIIIRKVREDEFLKVYNFVSHCKPLENYAEHFYKIMFRYFGNSCLVAEFNDEIVGFVMGFRSRVNNKTFFLWQIGVFSYYRGKEIGRILLEEFEKVAKKLGCKRIELTVDPNNLASQKLFEKTGYLNISSKEGATVKVAGKIAVRDYYRPGGHFILYEKRL